MKITFSAPERYLSALSPGTPIQVKTTAFAGELTGKVGVVVPIIDPATRNATIIARVDNDGHRLRPGMSAGVTAVLDERPAALTIPSESVFAEGELFLVYLITPEGTVARRPIQLGTRLPDVVEILDGLTAGDRVVKAGHQKLYEGARVAPIEAVPPGTEPPTEDTDPDTETEPA